MSTQTISGRLVVADQAVRAAPPEPATVILQPIVWRVYQGDARLGRVSELSGVSTSAHWLPFGDGDSSTQPRPVTRLSPPSLLAVPHDHQRRGARHAVWRSNDDPDSTR